MLASASTRLNARLTRGGLSVKRLSQPFSCRFLSTEAVGSKFTMGTPPQGGGSIILRVGGLKCGACVSSAEAVLQSHPTVHSATVNLPTGLAVVHLNGPTTQSLTAELAEALDDAGFTATVRSTEGLTDTKNGNTPNMEGDLLAAAALEGSEEEDRLREVATKRRMLLMGALAGVATTTHLLCAMPSLCCYLPPLAYELVHSDALQFSLATAAIAGPGRPIIWGGLQHLRRNTPNMDTLVSLGTLAAYTTSIAGAFFLPPSLAWEPFFHEPVMLLGVVQLGRLVEERMKHRVGRQVKALLQLQPHTARFLLPAEDVGTKEAPSDSVEVPVKAVSPGDLLLVAVGDRVPVDAEVVQGESDVDMSMVTGESLPVTVRQGTVLKSGTTNLSGPLVVKAVSTGSNSYVARLAGLVMQAQLSKAPVQRLADLIAGKFCYGVLGLSAATFAFWLGPGAAVVGATGPKATALAVRLATDVLVVACPCALGLATPLTMYIATAAAAARGLLFKGASAVETAAKVKVVALDKTGTLTTGKPKVETTLAIGQLWSEQDASVQSREALALASYLEKGTVHPYALAVVGAARQAGAVTQYDLAENTKVQVQAGGGVQAVVDGLGQVGVGSLAFLSRQGLVDSVPDHVTAAADTLGAQAMSVVALAAGGQVQALFGLRDTLRDTAVEAVERLKAQGAEVYLLTGDTYKVAMAVASSVGIPPQNVLAGLSPEDKATKVTQLKREAESRGISVAFVGDGVNDAPALAGADVGMAVQSGTEVAADAADIVLANSDPSQIPDAIGLGRHTMTIVKQNLAWAFGFNAICLPLAAGLLLPKYGIALTPSVSGGLMACSSLAVVANSLRLPGILRKKQL